MDTSILISLVIAGVAVCAALGVMGFKGRLDTVGIDLGTTYSAVALRSGKVTDVLLDAQGRALVPSAVYFAPDGKMLVGHDALAHQHKDPRHVIFNAKRFIGRPFDDEAVTTQSRSHPFNIVPNASDSHSGAWFDMSKQTGGKHNASVSPETVGEQILRHLLDIAEFNLGHRQIRKAVMAVPAKFDSDQRKATADAYKQAGLKVMRVIEEPTAAALAYGLDKKKNVDYILVYDFGGGTLDVSLLFVNEESVQVIATHGDDQLGGADFDLCLAGHVRKRLMDQMADGGGFHADDCPPLYLPVESEAARAAQLASKGFEEVIKTEPCAPSQTGTLTCALPCSRSNVRVVAEKIKRNLSSRSWAVGYCTARKPVESSSWGDCRVRKVNVTKVEFEEVCDNLFQRIMKPVHALLDEAGMPKGEVDEVVLVGGSSRIPRIREELKTYFNMDHLNTEIDPDITVAVGAASIVD